MLGCISSVCWVVYLVCVLGCISGVCVGLYISHILLNYRYFHEILSCNICLEVTHFYVWCISRMFFSCFVMCHVSCVVVVVYLIVVFCFHFPRSSPSRHSCLLTMFVIPPSLHSVCVCLCVCLCVCACVHA